MNPGNFFAELKRRNVYKVAVAYVIAAWLIIQAASILLPTFEAPAWVMKVLVAFLVLGFPAALIFSWAFEITPEGIRLESEIAPNESIKRKTGRKIVAITIVLTVIAAGLFVFQFIRARSISSVSANGPKTGDKSIAVLPFVNMSGDATNNDFSDGITEEILNALSQIPDLKVAARTSAFQFKGKNIDLRQVGETLGVTYVLEGSVQRADGDVRITAQLIDAQNGFHRWSEKYDRKLTSIFAIEDEISKAIASHLQVTLNNAPEQPLVKQATADPRAHELYLKGLARITERGAMLAEAVQSFKEAIAIDPNYAAAWAGLSQAQELLPWYQLAPWQTSLAQAEEAARRALTIDPKVAEAHTGLANVLRDGWNFAEATKEYRTALELNPGSAETINQYAQMLLRMGEFEEAVKQERAALTLDPLAPNPHYILGLLLSALHRHDEAIAEQRFVVSRSPNYTYAHFYLSYLLIYTEKYAEAEKQARNGATLVGEDPETIATLVRATGNPMERPAALKLISEGKVGKYSLQGISDAFWYALLKADNQAIQSMEQWAATGEKGQLFANSQILCSPAFDALRSDPRFQKIMRSISQPAAASSNHNP